MTEPTLREATFIDCGKDDCEPVEHWQRIAFARHRAALAATPPPPLDRDALSRAIHATGHCDVSSYQLPDRPGFGIRHDHDEMAAAILAHLATPTGDET